MIVTEESPTIFHIEFKDGRKLTIVGSAHISQKSVEDVKSQIDSVAPDSICIELDEDRWNKVHKSSDSSFGDFDLVKVIKSGKFFYLMVNIILASFQKRMSKTTTGASGMEIISAGDIAMERNIPLHFVDRNVSVTLKRAWACSSMMSKSKILASLFASAFDKSTITEEELEKLKEQNNIDIMLEEMAREMPAIKEVLIDERDMYLASKIYEASGNNKFAVVGQGHVTGLIKTLEKLDNGAFGVNVDTFNEIPQKKSSTIKSYIVPSIIILAIVCVALFKGWERAGEMTLAWAVCNMAAAFAGALITLAHPLTCIVAAVTSPIAALSPVLGVGIFAAITQATVCKTRVKDLEKLQDDVSSFKKWWTNRILHTFLILIVTSLASGLGTFLLFPLCRNFVSSLFGF